jgi:phage baseplate assembly protein W
MPVSRTDKYTATAKQSETYSDFTLNMDFHPDNHDLVRKVNSEAVKSSIRNLLRTAAYGRVGRPALGANVRKTLFEPMGPVSQAKLQSAVRSTVDNHEPRAKIITVTVDTYPQKKAYVVNLTFYIVNQSEPVTLQVILTRVR